MEFCAPCDPNDIIEFVEEKHVEYIKKASSDHESFEYVVTQHLRMSGVYWGLTALCILGRDLKTELEIEKIISWVLECQDSSTGGFGGSPNHDPHLLYTLSALQILVLCNALDRINIEKVTTFVSSLQQPDGSFFGDQWGEVDTRFSYCALSALSIMGKLRTGVVDVERAVDFILSCCNFDAGFGAVPGAESHAGQIFCCIGALSICESLHRVDSDLLGWWLSERQCDNGGLNGRPEKQADVCYSWWILSSLSILGRLSWIDGSGLVKFILQAQDCELGGISDRGGNMSDIFHTFFGICGLSLLGLLDSLPQTQTQSTAQEGTIEESSTLNPTSSTSVEEHSTSSSSSSSSSRPSSTSTSTSLPPVKFIGRSSSFSGYRAIDPTYALPVDLVQAMGLPAQTLPPPTTSSR